MMRKHVGFLTLVGAAVLAGCGGDDPVSVGDPLTEEEAAALGEVIFASALANTNLGTQPATVDGPQPVPVSVSQDVELTGPCELGGTVDIDGSVDYEGDTETEAFSLNYTVTMVHNDCMAMAQSTEQIFTLNGADHLTFQFSLASEGDAFELDGGMEGNVAWESEDRSGQCFIDYHFSGDVGAASEAPEGSFTFEGSVCGTTIDQNVFIG